MDSDHNYDMGSLYLTGTGWLVIAPLVNGPQIWGAGGEVAFCESTDNGKTWQMTRQVTTNSLRNHNYIRRPLNAKDPFYGFWADGDPGNFSISKLYFGDSKGNVWQLPYHIKKKSALPVKVKTKNLKP
jgi:hypothetical protein